MEPTIKLITKTLPLLPLLLQTENPNRSDFVDSSPNSRPLHETLYDTELGYKIQGSNFTLSATAYYMIYENQLILTGKINDVGSYTRENVDYAKEKV